MIQNFLGTTRRRGYPIHLIPGISLYLFGKAKSVLIRRKMSDKIDLFEVVTEILNGISHAEL
jgi:hypothetical protein